jgi:glyoxylase-like metal-dependent hydrolase (beta-lactamase superfamily II)
MPTCCTVRPDEVTAGTGVHVDRTHGVTLHRIVVGALGTNCWAVHAVGSREALLVDPGDEPATILRATRDLEITAIVLTHAHFDHVLAVADIAQATGAPVLAHPDDAPVWPHELDTLTRTGHFDAGTDTDELLAAGYALRPDPRQALWEGVADRAVRDGEILRVGRLRVHVLHTPGHTPGGLSLSVPGHLLTGDTLFPGGPGLTGWPLSDFPLIMWSVRRLLDHPPGTVVHPGHGADTTVGRERPSLQEWERRGW